MNSHTKITKLIEYYQWNQKSFVFKEILIEGIKYSRTLGIIQSYYNVTLSLSLYNFDNGLSSIFNRFQEKCGKFFIKFTLDIKY